jgi:HAD superfamily hydrolase (TIGR01509 family)
MLLDITNNIDVYVFDFDGTLVNSMPDFCQVMIDLIEEYTKVYPKNVLDIIVPLGYKGTIDYFKNVLKINESEEVLMQKLKDGLYKKYSEVICLKQGVYNALKYLKEKGKRLYILTASPHLVLDVCLKRNGVYDTFDGVYSCEDFNTTKSDVNIYYMLADKIGVKNSEIAFFDDNINSIMTAKKAGLYTVGVYDDAGVLFKEQLEKTANAYIMTFEEIK